MSASRTATPLTRAPLALTKLDGECIRALEASFTGEVLNRAPGVYMNDMGNEQHAMSIRMPLSTNAYYLYLEDGIPLRPLGLFNHNALYEVNLDGAGEIEVIRGPASSLYGSNSIGGTVNLLTRAPGFAGGGAELAVSGSDQGYGRSDFAVEGSIGNLALRASGYASIRRGGWQDHAAGEKQSVTLRGDYRVSDRVEWVQTLTHSHLRTDMPGTLRESDFRSRPGYSYHTFTYREVDASRYLGRLEGRWSDRSVSRFSLFLRHNSTEQLPDYLVFDTADPTRSAARRNDSDFSSVGFDVHHVQDLPWAQGRIVGGIYLDFTDNRFTEDNLTIVRDPASRRYLAYTEAGNRRNYDVELLNPAAYAELELTPFANARLSLGARYDVMRYDYRNRNAPGPTSGAPSETREYRHLSFRAGVVYTSSPATSFYASVGQGFAPPEVSALYGRLETPDLAEAVYTSFDLGIRRRLWGQRVFLDANVYRLEGEDEVVSYTIRPGLSEPRNAGRTRHEGLELAVDAQLGGGWSASAAAAYARHEYREYRLSPTVDHSGRDMRAAPRTIANVELAYSPPRLAGARVALEWVHLGSYWMNDANTVRYAGHDLLNLRASFIRDGWTFWAKLMNVTDERYAEMASSSFDGLNGNYDPDAQNLYLSGAPRTLTIGVRYSFGSLRD